MSIEIKKSIKPVKYEIAIKLLEERLLEIKNGNKEDLIWIDTQGFEANILVGANKLITSGAPIVIEFWPHALKQNNEWNKIKDIIKEFRFYSDLSKEKIQLEEVNQKNIDDLFSGWDEEQKNKPSLFTDLLLISDK